MENIIERSFALNVRIMKLFGLYPSEENSIIYKIWIYVLYLGVFGLSTILVVVKLAVEKNDDLMQQITNYTFATCATSLCIIVVPFLRNSHRIKKCMDYFGDPKYGSEDSEEEKLIEECIHVCQRNSKCFLYLVTITELLLWITPRLVVHQLPVDLWLPYNLTEPSAFYPAFCYQTAAVVYGGTISASVDPLIAGLAYHATTQIKILKYRLQHLDKFGTADQFSSLDFDTLCAFLGRCVDHHNSILEFIAEYETCFSFTIFCQFAGSLLGMSFCCVGMLKNSGASSDVFKSVTSFICISFQILFYCYYGTLLYEENNSFRDAIYMGSWYRYDSRVRRVLFLMMERSKTPMIMTAGKVVNVTLQTFGSVLKTSYSLVAVLSLTID